MIEDTFWCHVNQVSDFGRPKLDMEGRPQSLSVAVSAGSRMRQNPGGILHINPNLPPSPQPIYIEADDEDNHGEGGMMGGGGRFSPMRSNPSTAASSSGGIGHLRSQGQPRGRCWRRCCHPGMCFQNNSCCIS